MRVRLRGLGFLTLLLCLALAPSAFAGTEAEQWIAAHADTWVRDGLTRSQWSTTFLRSGKNGRMGSVQRSFVRFPQSAVDDVKNKNVLSAELWVYGTRSGACNRRVQARRLTQSFSSATVWTNQPAAASTVEGSTTKSAGALGCDVDSWIGIPVSKATIDGWANARVANRGLLVRATNETDGLAWRRFASIEGRVAPHLHITYNTRPDKPSLIAPAAGASSQCDPTLSATYADPEGGEGQVAFHVLDSGDNIVAGEWAASSAGRASWKVPRKADGTCVLEPGESYTWRAYAHDGRDLSVSSERRSYTVAGVLPGAVPDLTWDPPAGTQDRTAAALQDAGSKWVRLHVAWRDIETKQGVYDTWRLSEYEQSIARARSAGQRVLVMVTQTPSWASDSGERYAPPRNNADFGRFLRFLSERWRDKGIEAYEIWNEPNYKRFWTTGPNASEYAAMLKAAHPAVKAGDPAAKVVFAGPATNDWRFVEAAYGAGVKGYFDIMGAHPYSCQGGPDVVNRDESGRMTRHTFLGYRELRASQAKFGDAKPIWFTEFGWSSATVGCGVGELKQASFLKRAFELASNDPYVQIGFWYNFRNNYWGNDANAMEDQFGLLRTDFSRKPAYDAFKNYTKTLP